MLFSSVKGIRFNNRGLVPAIIQDAESKKVLMYVYMNREAVKKTKKTGELWLYHRSMKKTWKKGTRSGNTMEVVDMLLHHDRNVMVVLVNPNGPACHTGNESCFVESYLHREEKKTAHEAVEVEDDSDDSLEALRRLFEGQSDEVEIVKEGGKDEDDLLASLFPDVAREEAGPEQREEETEEEVETAPAGPAPEAETPESDFLERYYRSLRRKVSAETLPPEVRRGGLEPTHVVEKISEAAVQLAVAAARNDSTGLLDKEADIVRHLLLLLAVKGIPVERLKERLQERQK